MPKPFLSFDDQLEHLQRNKGLTIADPDYAKRLSSSAFLSESDLYAYMGFPSNWRKITAYRK